MPQHKIQITRSAKRLLHADATFNVYSAVPLLSKLKISKGAIDWRAPNQ